ncbi:MAG: S8 family serine peptidase, partial [Promethearchaeota archaeon]
MISLKYQKFLLISLICIILILPISYVANITSNTVAIKDLKIPPQNINQESAMVNLLFSFNPSERETITQVINQLNPSYIHLYRNFDVGFVTIQEKTLPIIQKNYPQIYSRLHRSQKIQVIPSIEHFRPLMAVESLQSSYISPAEIIGAHGLWNKGIDGSTAKIAIIDSGIDGSPPHGDFNGRIVYEESFVKAKYGYGAGSEEDERDYHGHGTHVAGIAAGAGKDYRGIAYNANLVNLKAADMSGHSTQESMLAAIDEAIEQSVDVISISIGFGESQPWGSGDELTLAVDSAVDAGISVVIAAGNEGSEDQLASIGTPGSAYKAITVGATNGSTSVASFSSRGPSFDYKVDPDIVAPGVQIIAPLAPNCLIELAYESLIDVETGPIVLGDYFILSGTSMATPVVSGAVALLKQQYKEATPAAIRAALQESAIDMEDSIYAQGSGLINVAGASTILELTKQNDGFNLISSLPKAETDEPVEFSERVTFPGDHSQIGISFVTGTSGTITWDISKSLEDFLHIDKTPHIQSSAGYFEKIVNLTIPLNTAPGVYQGNIDYTFLDHTYSIPLLLNVSNPNSKIYWDTHYTGKDDSSFFNYRVLDRLLASNQHFDINEYDTAFTWQNLSQNDILVLTDLEYPISNQELSFISDFHNQNGSILLVTSVFPYFNPDPYLKVLNTLGISANLTDRLNYVNYTDNGRERETKSVPPQDIVWDKEDPLFKEVDKLPFRMGTAFSVDEGDSSLKFKTQIQGRPYYVVAAYEPSNRGKILILGSELWLYSSFLFTEDGQNFVRNVFNWLKPETGLTVNSQISSNDRQLEISAYYNDDLPLSVEITFSNDSQKLESNIPYNTTLQHHRFIVELGEKQNQKISIIIKNTTNTLKKFDIFDLDNLPDITSIEADFITSSNVPIPSWADEEDYEFIIDQGIDFSLSHTASSSIQSNLLISNQLEDSFEVIIPPLDEIEEIIIETELLNNSNTQKSLSWQIPENFPTGYYSYEIQVWIEIEENFTILLDINRESFFIPDSEPIFDVRSTIGEKTLDSYRNIQTTADIPIWNPGQSIQMQLMGQDDNSNEFKVHVQLIHYYLWFVDRTVLKYFEIPQSTSNESENIGSFLVPTKPIPLPENEDFKVEINNQIFFLLIFLRDEQGNSNIEVIFFKISSSTFLDIDVLYIVVFGVLAVIVLLVVIIIIQKRTSYRAPQYMRPEYTYQTRYYPSSPER